MSARKLQHEFDRLNKKIAEGLTAFEEIKGKIQTCEVPSQREKLENDLKKELKKLQRCRDQLKLWLGDNGIKLDKNLLQDNRSKIEQAMDDFKEVERNSKIKQFSNEGLEMQKETQKQSRFGDVAKVQEACDYISDIIQQLNNQNDELDRELESLSQQMKKKGGHSSTTLATIEDIKYKIDRNNTHVDKLEGVLEDLENDRLDPAKIDDVKDDLDYYVEMNQDDDYVEYDEFYDQLEVADDDDENDIEIEGSLAQMATETIEEEERKRLELQQLGTQQSEATRATHSAASQTAGTTTGAPASASASASSALSHPHHSHHPSSHSGKPLSVSNEPHLQGHVSSSSGGLHNTANVSAAPVKKLRHQTSNVTLAPAPPPPITSGNSYSNVIKAAQAAQLNNNNNNNTNINTTTTTTSSSNNNGSSSGTNAANVISGGGNTTSHTSTPIVNNNVPLATALAKSVNNNNNTNVATPGKAQPPPGLAHIASANNVINNIARSQSSSPLPSQVKLHNLNDGELLRKKVSNASQLSTATNNTTGSATNGDGTVYFGDSINQFTNVANSRLQDPLPFQSISNLLESSLLNCPDSFDAEKPRQYTPKTVHPSLIDYPQEPMYELNSVHYMQKFDDDLLFCCFYYGEDGCMDNFAKWNAAKELTKRGWVFNEELSQWCLKSTGKTTGKIGRSRSSSIAPTALAGGNSASDQSLTENNGGGEKEVYTKYFDEKTWLIRNYHYQKV